jgi:peptidoglycan/xylan/chitin deacetylase (PgdA/CDA1 family)
VYDWNNEEIWTNKKKWEIQSSTPSLILSFDDGPSSALIPILDILKKHEVQAMFFWQSRLLYNNRPWKRVLEEGHIIGGHSLRHGDLTKLSREEQYKDIDQNKKQIEKITGQRIKYFRPPYGRFNEDTLSVLKELKLHPFLWEVAGLDWEHASTPEWIVSNICDHVKDGSVILLHELKQTVKVLEQLLIKLKKDGYQFVLPPNKEPNGF